jgi:hypothetical protein
MAYHMAYCTCVFEVRSDVTQTVQQAHEGAGQGGVYLDAGGRSGQEGGHGALHAGGHQHRPTVGALPEGRPHKPPHPAQHQGAEPFR